MVDQADMTRARPAAAFRDDDGAIRSEFLDRVREAIERRDATALQALVGELHEADTGDLIEALDAELRPRFVELLGREFDFAALTEVDDTVREEILEEVSAKVIAEGVRDLDSDDAAHIIEDLPAAGAGRNPRADAAARARARSSASCIIRKIPPAGGCRPSSSRCRRHWTVGDAIDHMRETVDLPDRFFELYVVDEGRKLLGAVALDRLLRTKRPVPVADLMDPDRRRVRATDDQEEVARMFERYNLVAAPVVDDGERLPPPTATNSRASSIVRASGPK